MYKKIMILMLTIFILTAVSFAENTFKININGKETDFGRDLVLEEDGSLFFPMEEFFSKMGIQYYRVKDSNRIIAYRDNMFLKFNINSSTVYLNGKAFRINRAPYEQGNTIYIPADFILYSLGIEHSFSEETNTLSISSFDSVPLYSSESSYLTRRISDESKSLSFEIPYHWQKLSDAELYGVENEYEVYKLGLEVSAYDEAVALSDFVTARSEEITLSYEETMALVSSEIVRVAGIDGHLLSYESVILSEEQPADVEAEVQELISEETYIDKYFFVNVNDKLYIFSSTSNISDPDYLDATFKGIISSMQFESISLDHSREHYVEFLGFVNSGMKLDSDVYSNIVVKDYLPFYGSIDPNIKKLDVIVKRKGRTYEYQIPVVEGEFLDRIYTPFGLGYHEIIIRTGGTGAEPIDVVSLGEETNLLVKFSVVNVSDNMYLYTMPSRFVVSNYEVISELNSSLLEGKTTNMEKALSIFNHIIENYSVIEERTETKEVISTKKGDSFGINAAYVTFLRNARVDSRIMKGTDGDKVRYWTEYMSNGKWFASDPFITIQRKEMEGNNFFFTVSKDILENQYEIEEMGY